MRNIHSRSEFFATINLASIATTKFATFAQTNASVSQFSGTKMDFSSDEEEALFFVALEDNENLRFVFVVF